jgi:PAS domain S-box-containing protein
MPRSLILVVDDNDPLRYAVCRTLRKHGFEVIEAATGDEALTLCGTSRPDLVILDVNLPDIHGFDVARRLKSGETTRNIPILQLSASSVRPEDRIGGLTAGADAFLVEPVEPGELVANIRALLRMRDAESTLQRTTAMLSAVVDSSPLAIVGFDQDRLIRTWNPAAERLFGFDAQDMLSKSLDALATPFLPHHVDILDRVGRGEPIAPIEYEYQRQDGTIIDIAMFMAPLERTSPAGYVAIFENISSRKQFERERAEFLQREREARKEAEAANRMKDEFLATLSHELRTPLNAVLGWITMLQQDVLDDEKRARALEIIERNARGQQELINDILQVAQIIRGQLRLDMELMNLPAAVEVAVESVRPTAAAKRQTIDVVVPEEPVFISADPARVQQILWNLLSNAVKYTPRGGHVEVSVTPRSEEIEVTVRDNGIGISPDILPHIFERFRQAENGPTREYGGLGLGLAIVRHLTEMHGGTVRASSEGLGHGSAFTITVPLSGVVCP